jgi:hypothetical protein
LRGFREGPTEEEAAEFLGKKHFNRKEKPTRLSVTIHPCSSEPSKEIRIMRLSDTTVIFLCPHCANVYEIGVIDD